MNFCYRYLSFFWDDRWVLKEKSIRDHCVQLWSSFKLFGLPSHEPNHLFCQRNQLHINCFQLFIKGIEWNSCTTLIGQRKTVVAAIIPIRIAIKMVNKIELRCACASAQSIIECRSLSKQKWFINGPFSTDETFQIWWSNDGRRHMGTSSNAHNSFYAIRVQCNVNME